MAYIWHHAFSVARRLPHHASRANDAAATTKKLLSQEPGAGCTTFVFVDAESGCGEEGSLEQQGQGERECVRGFKRVTVGRLEG